MVNVAGRNVVRKLANGWYREDQTQAMAAGQAYGKTYNKFQGKVEFGYTI